MAEKYQRKFYSDTMTDMIIDEYKQETGFGYSETIRAIILQWSMNILKVPVKGIIKDGKVIMEQK